MSSLELTPYIGPAVAIVIAFVNNLIAGKKVKGQGGASSNLSRVDENTRVYVNKIDKIEIHIHLH